MCKSPLHPFLARLPKCEHHMHLEGALTPALTFQFMARNKISIPEETLRHTPCLRSAEALQARIDATYSSLDDFLQLYTISQSTLIEQRDFEDLAWDFFTKAHSQGVKHVELFFDPQAHTCRGIAYATVVAGIDAARTRAEQEYGLSSLRIACFLRHLPVKPTKDEKADFSTTCAEATYTNEILPELQANTLAGIGIDSSESNFPPQLFADIYTHAAAAGHRRTAHAGEEVGPQGVRDALAFLQVHRIDHGRTLAEDEELLKEVAERQTLVTMCPLSNRCLKGVKHIEDLPVRKFLDAGVRFSVNSDDPAYFGGYILENYCAVQEAFDLSRDEWMRIAEHAIAGSWCEEARKAELRNMLAEVGHEFKHVS